MYEFHELLIHNQVLVQTIVYRLDNSECTVM